MALYGNRPCLGRRRIVDGVAQPYEFITYNEVAQVGRGGWVGTGMGVPQSGAGVRVGGGVPRRGGPGRWGEQRDTQRREHDLTFSLGLLAQQSPAAHRPPPDSHPPPPGCVQITATVGSAFSALGLQPKDRIGVIGANCPEWMMAMQASGGGVLNRCMLASVLEGDV